MIGPSHPLTDLAEELTPRESEVFQMLASGLANKEIVARLSISEHRQISCGLDSWQAQRGPHRNVSLGIRRGIVFL